MQSTQAVLFQGFCVLVPEVVPPGLMEAYSRPWSVRTGVAVPSLLVMYICGLQTTVACVLNVDSTVKFSLPPSGENPRPEKIDPLRVHGRVRSS